MLFRMDRVNIEAEAVPQVQDEIGNIVQQQFVEFLRS